MLTRAHCQFTIPPLCHSLSFALPPFKAVTFAEPSSSASKETHSHSVRKTPLKRAHPSHHHQQRRLCLPLLCVRLVPCVQTNRVLSVQKKAIHCTLACTTNCGRHTQTGCVCGRMGLSGLRVEGVITMLQRVPRVCL